MCEPNFSLFFIQLDFVSGVDGCCFTTMQCQMEMGELQTAGKNYNKYCTVVKSQGNIEEEKKYCKVWENILLI